MTGKREKLIPNDHHNIDGGTISGKIIEIGTGPAQDFICGGALLDDCELRILCGANSVNLFNVTIRNSIIKTRRELKNLPFLDVQFDGCKFLGKYSGCRFGQLESKNIGSIANCDFGEAQLDLCDFLSGSDVDSLVFPSWPHVVVRRPDDWRDEWLAIPFPEDFLDTQEIVVDPEMVPSEAIVIYLPADCPDHDSMRATLAGYENIIIND